MHINWIELKGNTRLMIRGTDYIKLTFTEVCQIIIGTNGCGKSTIIQELSPLPPVGSDYLKNGYKKINISNNKSTYTLTSVYTTQAGKHSFIDDNTGEDLNEGGTQSVQKTLVQEVFGFDAALHDVLTDQVKFTNMSPLVRRDWLTRISGTNLDYAIALFNKLKRLQRDEEAVVKHLTNRLNKESDNMPSIDDLTTLQSRFNNLDEQIKELYNHRVTSKTLPVEEMYDIVQDTIANSISLAQEILRADTSQGDGKISSVGELQDAIRSLRQHITTDEERIEEHYKEHTDISNLLRETQDISDEKQLQKLKDRLVECSAEIDELKSQTVLIHECENAMEIYGRTLGIKDQIIDIATEFVDNTEGYFTKAKRMETTQAIDAINLEITNHSRQVKQIEHNIDHITRTDSTVCPKCNHTFKVGVSADDLPGLEKSLSIINQDIHKLQERKDVLVSYMDEYTKYRNNYIKYMDVLNRNRDLKFLEQHIKPIDLLEDSPSTITRTLAVCISDLDKLASIERLMPEMFKLEAAIDKVNSVKSNGNYTQERLVKIEDMISSLKARISDNNLRLEMYTKQYDTFDKINKLYKQLTDKLEYLNSAMQATYTSGKKDAIERMITKVNTDVAHVNMELNQARNRQSIVDDVARQRNITLDKSNNFKILVNEINPTTGLIADYFKQFIDQFVEQMNVIINKVWEHNIELLPCDVDSNGISYKFPLRVNDKPYGPPDGSKGSNSQVSIVNFAFKIVVMVYLGLDDYPLFLDELAPDLDEKHRINIMTFVRDFVESKRCSQLFMVSHYATGYGAFSNAEVLVLDDENLLNVPAKYNEHVVIKKDATYSEEA